jgi:hypothetical protein
MTGLFARIRARCLGVAESRSPDFVIGGDDDPYLRRWFLIPRNRVFNLYLHEFLRDDDDRALHDHPWFNFSWLLKGWYVEHTVRAGGVSVRRVYRAGHLKFRSPWAAHRIELINGQPCFSLFVTGPRLREWGFHCPNGWRHWRDFTGGERGELIGRGCD